MSAYRPLKEYPGCEIEFLQQPAEWIFQEGACHVFAFELYEFFRSSGVDATIVILANVGATRWFATHVLVKAKGKYWDVNGSAGPSEVCDIWTAKAKWAQEIHEIGQPETVISSDNRPDSDVPLHHTIYLHCAMPDFINVARGRAKLFIQQDYALRFLSCE